MTTYTSPNLSAIVAMSENQVIGKNNQLPWRLPADLRHFKAITTGHPILMGRKTYASIGRPLPNRSNIILTRDPSFSAPGCTIVHSLSEALSNCESARELFVIGGADLYQQLLPKVQRLYLTLIHQAIEGDTYFPALDWQDWQIISREDFSADAENPFAYSFLCLTRHLKTSPIV